MSILSICNEKFNELAKIKRAVEREIDTFNDALFKLIEQRIIAHLSKVNIHNYKILDDNLNIAFSLTRESELKTFFGRFPNILGILYNKNGLLNYNLLMRVFDKYIKIK